MRKSEILASESVICLTQKLSRLREIWQEIGIPEHQRFQRIGVVNKHLKDLLDKMIAEEENLQERLLQSITLCRKELAILSQELQLLPFQEEEDSTVLQLEKDLRTRVEILRKQKRDRKQELKALQEQDRDLCDLLCETPYVIDSEAVPSLAQLDAFRRHLVERTAEKERRRMEFFEAKQEIVRRMEELERSPDTSFERDVICEDEEAFCFSTQNIAALKDLLQQLEAEIVQKDASCEELRCRILTLWDRLQIPVDEREAFAPYMAGSTARTMNSLQSEVDRLEKLKLHKLQSVVEAVRVELADFWDKCFYGDEQKRSFTPYYQDNFTEELLQEHDDEVERLKRYYETHRELFEAIHKWEENWHLFQELERKATDPSRFANRGGNLLKEEKLRVKLQKTLPKLEEELKGRVELWEQEHGQDFLVRGQRFLQYVPEQWRLYHMEKERERQERQLKKSRQIEEEMRYGTSPQTPSQRRALGLTTPGKVRKFNITASTPNSTIRSVLGSSMFSSPATHSPLFRKMPLRTPGFSATKPSHSGLREHNKENFSQLSGTALSGGCTSTAPLQRPCSISSVASTYSEFARELSKASSSEARSGVLNSTASNVKWKASPSCAAGQGGASTCLPSS